MAILQGWSRIRTEDRQEQIQLAVSEGLELGVPKLQVQLSNRLPLSLLKVTHYHVIHIKTDTRTQKKRKISMVRVT